MHPDARTGRRPPSLGDPAPVAARLPGGDLVAGQYPASIATDELAQLAVRRLTDAAAAARPLAALRPSQDYLPGDTDLAWTRLTRVAGTAGRRAGPVPVTDQVGLGRGRAEQPVGRVARRLAAEPAEGSGDARKISDGPGITAVRMTTAAGDIAITRPDGLLASYAVPGQPERLVALKRREITDLISEELRRLDADQVYATPRALLVERRCSDQEANGAMTDAAGAARSWSTPAPTRWPKPWRRGCWPGSPRLQRDFRMPQVALTGGRIATQAYTPAGRRGPPFRGRLDPGRTLVGRRALRARRRRRPQRQAGPGPARRPRCR